MDAIIPNLAASKPVENCRKLIRKFLKEVIASKDFSNLQSKWQAACAAEEKAHNKIAPPKNALTDDLAQQFHAFIQPVPTVTSLLQVKYVKGSRIKAILKLQAEALETALSKFQQEKTEQDDEHFEANLARAGFKLPKVDVSALADAAYLTAKIQLAKSAASQDFADQEEPNVVPVAATQPQEQKEERKDTDEKAEPSEEKAAQDLITKQAELAREEEFKNNFIKSYMLEYNNSFFKSTSSNILEKIKNNTLDYNGILEQAAKKPKSRTAKIVNMLGLQASDAADLHNFKEAYLITYRSSFFKNPLSKGMRSLFNASSMSQIRFYAQQHPNSRTAFVLSALDLRKEHEELLRQLPFTRLK